MSKALLTDERLVTIKRFPLSGACPVIIAHVIVPLSLVETSEGRMSLAREFNGDCVEVDESADPCDVY